MWRTVRRDDEIAATWRCGWFAAVCAGRARAPRRVLFAVAVSVLACSGGDGDDGGSGSGDASPSCEERRIAPDPGRWSVASAEPVPFRSTPLPALTSRPVRRRTADPAAPRSVGMRVLLIAPDEQRVSYQAAAAALQRIAVPYDILLSADEELDRDRLYDQDGACRYAGVILSHTDLTWDDGSGWASSFSDEEWALLADYEQSCAAREVIWYARPSEDLGLVETGSFDDQATETATLTDEGAARFPYLVRGAAIPIRSVNGYRAEVIDPASTRPLLEAAGGGVLAAVHTRPDLTEVLALMLDSGARSIHSQLVEFGIVEWVTHGLFIGERRLYLAPHIDDVFLRNALWSETGGEAFYRMTAADVARLLAWSNDLPGRLPAGSSVRNHLAFNGAGAQPAAFPDQSLVDALLAAEREFYWINHTWSHSNLDAASENTAALEIARNCAQAEDWGLTHFRCSEAVTPELTGLANPEAVAGLLEAGVRHVVSDASRTEEEFPDNPGTNPSPNVGRENPMDPELFQVPRHPTGIFFNCSTEAEEVGLYNELYREHWGRDLTYAEIIEADTEIALSYLLGYDVDPLMFHQANLRFWYDGGWHSLYTDWIDRLVERFTALVDLPVIGLEMNDIAAVMQKRGALDRCGVTATLSADRSRIHLESTGACLVPITGLDAPDAGEVEHYGGVPTTHVALSACGAVDVEIP